MKKTIWFSVSLAVLLGLAGCGKKNNGNNTNALNPFGQNQFPNNYPYPNQSGIPVVPGVGPQQNCMQGQMRLRGQCFQTGDLAQACQWANGQMVNTQAGVMCRSERQLSGGISTRLMMIGSFRKDFQVNPQLLPGEVFKIYGSVTPRNPENGWQIQVTQNGTVVAGTQSGTVVSESDQNVLLYIVNGQGFNQQYNPQMTGQPYYGNVMMSSGYIVSLYGRGTTMVNLRGAAISCENGLGNSYPCQ